MIQQERDPVEVSASIITLIFGGALIFYAVFVDALPGGGWMVFGYVIARQTVETLQGLEQAHRSRLAQSEEHRSPVPIFKLSGKDGSRHG